MNDRPVRLVVRDDLRRSRLTVFFRLFLAVPHLFWWSLWGQAVFFSAIAQWFVTVVRGRPSRPLHAFHVHYVRYTAHFLAYATLVANSFPGFLGERGYTIDLEIDTAERQRRLSAAFRLLLAIPALFVAASISGALFIYGSGLLAIVAFLAWFAALVRGRMPLGLRNIGAYAVRYVAEVTAYVLLVTRKYPTTDPTLPPEAEPPPPHPIDLRVDDDRRRSRLTTFFRFPLSVPHFVWLTLWSVLVLFAVLANWFVALVAGHPARPLHRFTAAWLRYQTHVQAFFWLIANPFPGFTGRRGYPIDLRIEAERRQRRLVTAFRLLLAFPALLVSGAISWLLFAAGFAGWFAALALGRMPEGLRAVGAHALRYAAQTNGYVALVTDRYPFSGPPTEARQRTYAPEPATAPDAVPA